MVENPFQARLQQKSQPNKTEQTQNKTNPFAERSKTKQEEPESKGKSIARWIAQVPVGLAQGTGLGLLSSFINTLATGEAMNPSDIEDLEWAFQREGKEFDRDKYLQGVQQASELFPTVENIARGVENKTGIPLQPKTEGQKLLQMGATAGRAQPGSLIQKGAAAVTAPAVKTGLQEIGVPEPLAEIGGFGASGFAGALSPKGGPSLGAKTKPSGMPVRRFEKLTEPREVSPGKMESISKNLESDFKKISEDIFSKSPISETRAQLKENPAFKAEVREQFKKVESLAEALPEPAHSYYVKSMLEDNLNKNKGIGFVPDEYERDYQKFMKEAIKDIPDKDLSGLALVKQFRKNNKALGEAYDPSKPYAFNRAKKDVILDNNRAISDVIELQYPDSEFSNLFKQLNKKWSQISDVEAMDKFVDSMFDGKINFSKGKRFFENSKIEAPFKRALGEENFSRWESLMKDMLTSERAYNMLKTAKDKGWGDMASTAGAYILHPKLAALKIGYGVTKGTWKAFMDSLLEKPQLTLTWKKGVDALKKGDFTSADQEFRYLKNALRAKEVPESMDENKKS